MDWIGSRALLNVHKFTHTYVGGVFCLFFVTRILRVGVQIFILSRCGLFTIKSHIFAILKTVCNRNKYAWSYSLSSFWVLSLGVQWVQIVQIFSLSVWVVHHQITYFCHFFSSPEPKSHTFFSHITHSDKCSKTVLLNFLLSTPTVLGTVSTPTTVNLTINSAREQLSSSQR